MKNSFLTILLIFNLLPSFYVNAENKNTTEPDDVRTVIQADIKAEVSGVDPFQAVSLTLTVLAIIFAPLVALRVEKILEQRREIRYRKLHIFRTLMATRATKLSQTHVEALNMIDLTFTDKNEKSIRDKWKECLDQFSNAPQQPEQVKQDEDAEAKKKYEDDYNQYQNRIENWNKDLDDLMVELYWTMGKSLNYEFDKVHIKKGVYIPKEHSDTELELKAIRRGLAGLLWSRVPLRMSISDWPTPSEDVTKEQALLRELLIANFKGERALAVKVEKSKDDKDEKPKQEQQAATETEQ